jgi:hypothetical protein
VGVWRSGEGGGMRIVGDLRRFGVGEERGCGCIAARGAAFGEAGGFCGIAGRAVAAAFWVDAPRTPNSALTMAERPANASNVAI